VKYANELVLMAKEVIVLQGMLERLTEVVRRYGIERNVEEIKVMKISRKQPPPPVKIIAKAVFDNKENFSPTNWTYILGRN